MSGSYLVSSSGRPLPDWFSSLGPRGQRNLLFVELDANFSRPSSGQECGQTESVAREFVSRK
jgi:hypothetical protein